METRINIAEILRNKPHGIKLYSPIFGDCTYCYIHDETSDICVKKQCKVMIYFNFEGLYDTAGECLLFPSKEMRDWSKFSWKKGDALSCGVDNLCIFEKWANKEYTEFYAKFVTPNYSGNTFKTEKWSKETNKAVIKQYISNIEEFKGGKLNLTTLEIEKTQPEFKDGDIIKMTWDKYSAIATFWKYSNFGKGFNSHVFFNIKTKIIEYNIHDHTIQDMILRLATEAEKQQLFDALEKEGKAWDAEKKQIVDLKPNIELKPFDKVLVRDFSRDKWNISFFSFKKEDLYVCINHCSWNQCIPYNEETEHLLGTTDDWEGGEQ